MAGTKLAATPIGADAFLIAIATLALSLRFISRKLSNAGFWWDDWLSLAAWVCSPAHEPRCVVAEIGQAEHADYVRI